MRRSWLARLDEPRGAEATPFNDASDAAEARLVVSMDVDPIAGTAPVTLGAVKTMLELWRIYTPRPCTAFASPPVGSGTLGWLRVTARILAGSKVVRTAGDGGASSLGAIATEDGDPFWDARCEDVAIEEVTRRSPKLGRSGADATRRTACAYSHDWET